MDHFSAQTIGTIRSPWKEKFAVPRQPGLVKAGGGELHLLPPYNHIDAVRGLETFSHIWLVFVFHQTQEQGWKPLVRPPRLGGNQKMGVFASRSTFRPNPIGLSLVELKKIKQKGSALILELGSLDLVDGTPVIDIKPYLPFADAVPEALSGYAQHAPPADMHVNFTAEAIQQLAKYQRRYPQLGELISQVLAQDPRPAYRKMADDPNLYAVSLSDFNIRWRIKDKMTEVFAIEPQEQSTK